MTIYYLTELALASSRIFCLHSCQQIILSSELALFVPLGMSEATQPIHTLKTRASFLSRTAQLQDHRFLLPLIQKMGLVRLMTSHFNFSDVFQTSHTVNLWRLILALTPWGSVHFRRLVFREKPKFHSSQPFVLSFEGGR